MLKGLTGTATGNNKSSKNAHQTYPYSSDGSHSYSSVLFRSRWHQEAQESPYRLQPIPQKFLPKFLKLKQQVSSLTHTCF